MRELGGLFTLPNLSSRETGGRENSFEGVTLTDSGRSAFILILDEMKSSGVSTVLLPEYLCEDAFYPQISDEGMKAVSYSIDRFLQPKIDEGAIQKADAVVFIRYFGLVDPTNAIRSVKKLKPSIRVIFDCSQDVEYFSRSAALPEGVDFAFCSYRKFFPVISGGGLKAKKPLHLPFPGPVEIQSGNWKEAYHAAVLAKEKMLHSSTSGASQEFAAQFDLYRKRLAENHRAEPIDSHSVQILKTESFSAVFEARKRNFSWLQKRIEKISGLEPLVNGVDPAAPLFLPVQAPGKRDALVKFLRSEGIFCPVHWPLDLKRKAALSRSALEIYENSFSLLIDQRMTEKDLEWMASKIEGFLAA